MCSNLRSEVNEKVIAHGAIKTKSLSCKGNVAKRRVIHLGAKPR